MLTSIVLRLRWSILLTYLLVQISFSCIPLPQTASRSMPVSKRRPEFSVGCSNYSHKPVVVPYNSVASHLLYSQSTWP
ncbi:hypothetical protein IW261DRAFT_1439114 [Armillaria novae-zelandiae]|uniref:Secreted protein n=1 Tax=Armillaria novae-zelandiae TaxID=153914 RepID=A0AA39UQG3_9AGAR|nr:hypothetical protein IW261DRAFT_1439114 [Armillaria novae-zelandiae]